MKVAQTLPLAALLASSAAAIGWFPACAWNDCLSSYNGTTCSASTGWKCLCKDSSAIDTLNSCVATACSNSTGQEAIYAAIAQVCANAGSPVTAKAEATFSATSGGSAWPSGWSTWGGAPWFSAVSSALPGAPTAWSGSGPWGGPGAGYRGPGSGGWGPCSWSTWSGWSSGAWSSGTWSSGAWPTGGPGGPHGGPGGYGPPQGAPWTSFTGTWTDCSTTVAASTVPTSGVSTVTTTINGQVVTGTTFQGKGAAATSTSASTGTSGAMNLRGMGACGALAVALVGTILAL